MAVPEAETALVVLVPQAEELVASYRDRYDPSAGEGMPAHITVLYPFMPPHELDGDLFAALEEVFAALPAFHFQLPRAAVFPDVLYLVPEPKEAFMNLTRAVNERFPELSPYGGVHEDIVPHLTVAHADDPARLQELSEDFRRSCEGRLPVEGAAEQVSLMSAGGGRWEIVRTFPLREE